MDGRATPSGAEADPRGLTRRLITALDAEPALQDALPRLAGELGSALGVEAVGIWTLDPVARRLRCTAFWAADPPHSKRLERETLGAALDEGDGLAGRAWRSAVPVSLDSPDDDPRLAGLDPDERPSTVLAVPLTGDEDVVGVAEVFGIPASHDVALERSLLGVGGAVGAALERRLAEEAAGAERARLEVALAAGRMGVWDWDLRSNRLRWSEVLERMGGLPPGVFGGTVEDYVELIHPDDRDWVVDSYLRQFERGTDQHILIEHRVCPARGGVHWWQVRGRALRDSIGEITAMTGVVIDITDEVERQQTARTRLAQLDLVAEVARLGTWEYDARRNSGRWSEAIIGMLGLDSEASEVTAEDLVASLHHDDHWTIEAMIEAASAGRDYHARYRVVRPSGEVRVLESWGRPLHDVSGELIGMAGITVDLTEEDRGSDRDGDGPG